MEDKELQELFDAKRTVEANRRRQEQLAALTGANAVSKSRRLWPLWVASAAAGIALLLMTIPSLFNRHEPDPIIVAQAPDIELTKEPENDIAETVTHNYQIVQTTPNTLSNPNNQSIQNIQSNQSDLITPTSPAPDTELSNEPSESVEPAMNLEQPSVESAPTAPLIHRRSSTRLGSTNNTTIKRHERPELRQILADVLGNDDNNSQVTLKNFDIS